MKHPIRHSGADPDKKLCQGKRIYASRVQAETVKEQQEMLFNGLELNIYRCLVGCRGWHLTRVKVS